jgi:5-methylcytosine-specific restriction endonuclease McrA
MRIEIIIFLITAGLMANLYTEGKYVKMALAHKKYYQMAGIAVGGLIVYWLLKKNPVNAGQMILASNEYLKYLPIDKNTSSMISPILDFTSKQNFNLDQHNYPFNNENHPIIPIQSMPNQYERKIMTSGLEGGDKPTGKTKRSVSETKKKFVAARQGWKCGDCQDQLNAWFEVDHKIRLEYGGSNHVDNLVALCRDCHGKKTTIENL